MLAIGGAFASVGVGAEAGGTAVSKVLQSMTEAVATGNKNMQVFAAVAGMSAAEFATAWREDAGEAFTRFLRDWRKWIKPLLFAHLGPGRSETYAGLPVGGRGRGFIASIY